MSIPKAGSRLLQLGGRTYRWRVRRGVTYSQATGERGLSFAVEDTMGSKGAVLVVSLDVPHPSDCWLDRRPSRGVTPVEVAGWVQRALALGWQPDKPGAQFVLSALPASRQKRAVMETGRLQSSAARRVAANAH